jgi:hypothetical protein
MKNALQDTKAQPALAGTGALRKFLARIPQWQRDEILRDRYGELDRLAGSMGVDPNLVRGALLDINRERSAEGWDVLRAWHEAILLHPLLSATEKVASLRVWCFVNSEHLYAWPSQDRLAKELGYSRGPNLGKALKRSFEIGAFTPIVIKNLPPAIKEMATAGSFRSTRGIAYRLNPTDRWAEEAAAFASGQNPVMFHDGTLEGSISHHLNREGNHERAAHGFASLSSEDKQQASHQEERLNQGTEGAASHG